MGKKKTVSDELAYETAVACGVPDAEEPESLKSADPDILALQARVDLLEELLIEGFQFAANELRPLFGQGALALVFDGVADGIQKKVSK
jgi:hypothetical protein